MRQQDHHQHTQYHQPTQRARDGDQSSISDITWRADVSRQLREINGKVIETALALQALSSSMMTRKEIEDADNRRVSTDQYASDIGAIRERLLRLEGSAGRILPWVALIVSTLLGLVGITVSIISLLHTSK
jgi:hypothetical protein